MATAELRDRHTRPLLLGLRNDLPMRSGCARSPDSYNGPDELQSGLNRRGNIDLEFNADRGIRGHGRKRRPPINHRPFVRPTLESPNGFYAHGQSAALGFTGPAVMADSFGPRAIEGGE